jgi:hypothetical protein
MRALDVSIAPGEEAVTVFQWDFRFVSSMMPEEQLSRQNGRQRGA